MRTCLLLTAVLLLSSCRPKEQRATLSEDKLKFVFIALLEENERSRNSLPDTSRHFNADSIFQANGTTEQEFRSTLAEFKADPQKWQKLLEEATKELEEREKGGSTKPKG